MKYIANLAGTKTDLKELITKIEKLQKRKNMSSKIKSINIMFFLIIISKLSLSRF